MNVKAKEDRLNWGCGGWVEPGWINSDIKEGSGIVSADILSGLPFADGRFSYVVSIHALPELQLNELVPALKELRRVLQPHGVLRIGLPDLERAVQAYLAGDRSYFVIPDEEESTLGGKLITQLLWYGYSRSLFTFDFVADRLRKAGFGRVERCGYRQTTGPFPEIVDLDNRERESLFVEAYL
jgi:SAM-dependent methyltransferase